MATREPSSAPAEPTEQGAPRRVRPADDDVAHIQAGLAEVVAVAPANHAPAIWLLVRGSTGRRATSSVPLSRALALKAS